MREIQLLDHDTIDKIAAGEVVERPSSIVKELVENAIDAGADSIIVEVKEGGIKFLRVTDNGCGIDKTQIRKAFLRHATSKISNVDDLNRLVSLGFRGEALSSISAVSQMEMITKTPDDLTGIRIYLEGGVEQEFTEVGAPDGTTIIVRNLFFNVPARRKFLKQPQTEAGYIYELMEHLALSHPYISFQYVQNGQLKLTTSGDGDLKNTIYRLYGKETTDNLIPISQEDQGIKLTGYLGKPSLNRGTRSFEIYFLNGRFIKSNVISNAIEEAYHAYVMQHRYPFCVLMIQMDPSQVDVNVHPAKREVRFDDNIFIRDYISSAIKACLDVHEMIPTVYLEKEDEDDFFAQPIVQLFQVKSEKNGIFTKPEIKTAKDFSFDFDDEVQDVIKEESNTDECLNVTTSDTEKVVQEEPKEFVPFKTVQSLLDDSIQKIVVEQQMEIPEHVIMNTDNRKKFVILGQVFKTYWLILMDEQLLIVDQHAAHEKVKFERLSKQILSGDVYAQTLLPPVIISLTGKEKETLMKYKDTFSKIGFAIEEFGGNEIALRSAPVELFGNTIKDLFLEVLDSLEDNHSMKSESVELRIATMSCKAAVKGNMSISQMEMETLLDEMLKLENPYFCPHGRPTMISFTKQELDKKFKRIV